MKDFMLKIPVDLHQKLKVIAAVNNITMTGFILEAVKEKMERMEEE